MSTSKEPGPANPFHLRFIMPTLDFKGKQHIYAHHLAVPYRPLVPDASKSYSPPPPPPPRDLLNNNRPQDFSVSADDAAEASDDNLIIHGDNLHALKALLPRYAGRIKCIYIDPPYNTGNEGWCYNDNTNSPLMQEWLKQNNPVDGEDLERHDKWLCMMWPRLHLLRELLSDDGVIFVSIDDNEQHHLRMIMDEIFGERNYFATLSRRAMHTVRNSSKDFNNNTDYVLVFAKEKSWWGENKDRYIRLVTEKSAYKKDDNDGLGSYKLDPIHARNYYEPYVFLFKNGVEWSPPSGTFPRYSRATLKELDNEGRIVFAGKEPLAKRYLSEVQEGQPPDTFLRSADVGFNKDGTSKLRNIFGKGGVFAQPKPVRLISFLLKIIRDKDAIVLDSFAGSGTTAHAVLALNKADGGNRKFIMVECEDYADTITAERVRRVIKGVPEAKDTNLREGLGGSFTYCTLGEPIDIESMLTGASLPAFSELAAYLLHTSSGISAGHTDLVPQDEDGLFYSNNTTDHYLLYEPSLDWLRSNEAVFSEARANRIFSRNQTANKRAIVFAAGKYIGQRDLTDKGITFCQLPYEMHRTERTE